MANWQCLNRRRVSNTRKLCYRKVDRAMRPMYGCPENFRDSLTMPTTTFPKIFYGLLFEFTLWMCVQNLKSAALPDLIPEIIGVPKNLSSPWICSRSLLSKIFNGLLFGCILWMYLPNYKSVALPLPELIGGIQNLGLSLSMPTQGDAEGGRGWYRSKERLWVPIGRP